MGTLDVTVYSKSVRVQRDATYRGLDRHGIAYDVVGLTQDPAALELMRSLGSLQALSSSPVTPTRLASAPGTWSETIIGAPPGWRAPGRVPGRRCCVRRRRVPRGRTPCARRRRAGRRGAPPAVN